MGEDKDENDLLIKYGFPEDIWYAPREQSFGTVAKRTSFPTPSVLFLARFFVSCLFLTLRT